MKGAFTCTSGVDHLPTAERVAIVGAGTSLNGADLSVLDSYDATVGLGRSAVVWMTSYLVVDNPATVPFIANTVTRAGGTERVTVLSTDALSYWQSLVLKNRRGLVLADMLREVTTVWSYKRGAVAPLTTGTLGVGLAFARLLQAKRVDLYGVDCYRTANQRTAGVQDSEPPPHNMKSTSTPGVFIEAKQQERIDGLNQHRDSLVGDMLVTNTNGLSSLQCFSVVNRSSPT